MHPKQTDIMEHCTFTPAAWTMPRQFRQNLFTCDKLASSLGSRFAAPQSICSSGCWTGGPDGKHTDHQLLTSGLYRYHFFLHWETRNQMKHLSSSECLFFLTWCQVQFSQHITLHQVVRCSKVAFSYIYFTNNSESVAIMLLCTRCKWLSISHVCTSTSSVNFVGVLDWQPVEMSHLDV